MTRGEAEAVTHGRATARRIRCYGQGRNPWHCGRLPHRCTTRYLYIHFLTWELGTSSKQKSDSHLLDCTCLTNDYLSFFCFWSQNRTQSELYYFLVLRLVPLSKDRMTLRQHNQGPESLEAFHLKLPSDINVHCLVHTNHQTVNNRTFIAWLTLFTFSVKWTTRRWLWSTHLQTLT